MTDTPNSSRLHITFLGERNSGKSSLLNALTGQSVAIVSPTAGTTTDCVTKAMELPGLGACLLTDTAGVDDEGELGEQRVQRTREALRDADIVVAVTDAQTLRIPEVPAGKALVSVINKCDLISPQRLAEAVAEIKRKHGKAPIIAQAINNKGIPELIRALQEAVPEDWDAPLLTKDILNEGDLAVLVMPQDSQAPKGRLILPQQQTIRELLDRGCRTVCCTTALLKNTLDSLKEAPKAIITDSQEFAAVKELTPEGVTLTSFSILLAASKGDIEYFKKSARKIDSLTENSKVLIAEACTHSPASEDIGRVKIPRMLRKKAGEGLQIDVVSGRDFPEDLTPYSLIIHCGACMFNRRYVLSRVRQAKEQGVPMTNYGVTIAYIKKLFK